MSIIKKMFETQVFDRAAQLAFYFLLSLFPFLIFAITIIGFLPLDETKVLEQLMAYTPNEAKIIIEPTIKGIIGNQYGGLLSFSILMALLSVSNGVAATIRALNDAYDTRETRSFVKVRLLTIFLTIGMVVAIITNLILQVLGISIGQALRTFFPESEAILYVWGIVRWGLSISVLYTTFVFIYFMAPNKKITIKQVYKGALFTTVGWISVSQLFSYFVSNFGQFNATYGSIGGFIILMIWFYLCGLLLLTGGLINSKRTMIDSQLPPPNQRFERGL